MMGILLTDVPPKLDPEAVAPPVGRYTNGMSYKSQK